MKTCDAAMTDAEARCYIDRYPDLKNLDSEEKPLVAAVKHYNDWGIYEGRQKFCAPRITDQQAQCYLDRYPDLQNAFGTDDNSWILAKAHWYNNGFNEGRLYNCERSTITKCAEQGEKCSCNGMVYFTTLHNHGSQTTNPSTRNDFTQALQYAFRQENPGNDKINCNKRRFGDVNPGQSAQCFCETPIPA